jgi:phosphoribosyl 1,2-cyclic phosphodiesterase
VPCGEVGVGQFRISSALVCHPNPTVGYRIAGPTGTVTYLPDHEPALGLQNSYLDGEWTSGYGLAAGSDLLIHDAQYSDEEYEARVGWGHSSMNQAFAFASLAKVKRFVPFHHDPTHSDDYLDRWIEATVEKTKPAFAVTPGTEGASFELSRTIS